MKPSWSFTHRVDFISRPEWNLRPQLVLEDYFTMERYAAIPMVHNEQAAAWARSLNAWQRLRVPTYEELDAGRSLDAPLVTELTVRGAIGRVKEMEESLPEGDLLRNALAEQRRQLEAEETLES